MHDEDSSFLGFTARRGGALSAPPETPTRRGVASFQLGDIASSTESTRAASPEQPPASMVSPSNPFASSSRLYRTPSQGLSASTSGPAPARTQSTSVTGPPQPAVRTTAQSTQTAAQPPQGPSQAATQHGTSGPTQANSGSTAQAQAPTTQSASQSQTNPDLAAALVMLAQTLQNPAPASSSAKSASYERNNVRDPDPFDGADTTKLRSFFAQLELVFKARPRTFDTDEKKVTYAISHLKGIALAWFEPFLLESPTGNPPVFMSDYEVFQDELRANFGPYDVVGTAEHELENLSMSDNQRVARYITQFNRLATQVEWGPGALRYQFYKGLPARLKDRISEIGKPKDLNKLRELAQSIDARYWERKTEQNRETRTSSSSNKISGSSKSPTSSSSFPTSGHSSSSSKPSTPKNPPKPGTPKTPPKTPKPYADKLGKDGKLTQEERQRRFANNLCLFCGGAGHTADACPKKSVAAKGRAAQVAEAPVAPENPPVPAEPKN